jgi:uncharacterized protein (DUF2132 family)
MSDEIEYKNNPLHGLSLKNMLIEIVDHYGFELLYAYLALNCFKTNADIASSVKFLKKTDWARERVETFYLYQFKNLPRCSSEQFEVPPRARLIPEDQTPGEPAQLSFEDAERLQEKRERKAAEHDRERSGARTNTYERSPKNKAQPRTESKPPSDIWAKAKAKKFD